MGGLRKLSIILRTLCLCLVLTLRNSAIADERADGSQVDPSCVEDGSITIMHQDIHFILQHNQTFDFVSYRVQTNITFRIRKTPDPTGAIALSSPSGTFRFQLHGRCPSWGAILNNDAYILAESFEDSSRIDNLEITCCHTEKDAMIVKFTTDLGDTIADYNFTLVLPTLKERTETDLVGVTRVPLTPSGYLLPVAQQYNSSYTGSAMAMTNFHDIFARHSFPLVDSLTSLYTMTLSITVEDSPRLSQPNEEWAIMGNTPIQTVRNSTTSRRPGKTYLFEPSPRMPGSYLAFAVGRFKKNSVRTKRGVEVSFWTLPSSAPPTNGTQGDSTRFALDMTATLIDYFEDEFDYPYPLGKMDIVEAPLDYEAFIVWGLCFVKPGRLHVIKGAMFQSAVPGSPATMGGMLFGTGAQSIRETIPRKKEITEILAHEIAHQWFGSLVTPKTWNDVFLSESFATFYGVEAIRFAKGMPQWMASEAMITALTHRKISLHTDPTIAISSPIMYKNWSRDVQFSTIVYHKGATLLRMLKWVIGDRTFRDGVRKYLHRFRYANAGSDDFLNIFDETVKEHRIAGWDGQHLDAKAFLSPYLFQPSYPIVNVRVNETHAVLTQEPFQHHQTSQRQQHAPVGGSVGSTWYQWYIPITVHLQSKHMRTYWLKPNETMTLPMSDFGFMVRLFHLYAVRPVYATSGGGMEEGEDGDGDEGDGDDVNVLD